MEDNARFPVHPFWNYSVPTYGIPGVADACISLQDEFGLNVNLLLFCIWSGAEGPGRLESEQIRECSNKTRDWQERVVKPLRASRRYSKHEPIVIPDALRNVFCPGLLAVEIDAEHVEQLAIAGIVKSATDNHWGATDRSAQQRGDDAIRNLLTYLAIEDIALEERVSASLRVIVGAAFPDSELTALACQALVRLKRENTCIFAAVHSARTTEIASVDEVRALNRKPGFGTNTIEQIGIK